MHHFFVTPEDVSRNHVIIMGSDVNHIKNVLRMKENDELLISDGMGRDYHCSIDSITNEKITAEILDTDYEGCELSSRFYLFQGMPKADKMELIIQKAVELGVHEIIPVLTRRSVVKIDDKKKESKLKRFQSISESAAKQSRRNIVPKVNNFMLFEEALNYAKDFSMNIIPYENFKDMQATRNILDRIEDNMNIGIFIGPEGGFDETEIDKAREIGCNEISLGKRILRTETAGMAILSVLMFKLER
jgi:16S rRNA (uracil1498-N3)-methyltransferase